MGIIEIILVSIGLGMDAFAVSLASAMSPAAEKKKLYAMPVVFCLFQAVMPLIGFAAGGLFANFISKYSGIAVFIILALIGANMLKEGIQCIKNGQCNFRKMTWVLVFTQGIATSIDALAVGVGIRVSGDTNILLAICIIGAITLVMCAAAVFIGKKAGDKMGGRAEILGGIILCIIGIKALIF